MNRAFGGALASFGSVAPAATPYIVPIIAAIIAVVLIVIVIIVIVQMESAKPVVSLKGPVDLFAPKSPVVIDRNGTKANMTGSYTLAFYLRIDAVPDMRAGATPLFTWPGDWNLDYNASQEQLEWKITEIYDGKSIGSPHVVVLPKVPMQRWLQITVAVEGRTMDLYVNGELIKSHTLDNIPNSGASSITIVPGGIRGQIAYVQLWSRRFTVSAVGANFVDTSDSQGRPYLGPGFLTALHNISVPNLFCPSGDCTGTKPTANPSQAWEFPYA